MALLAGKLYDPTAAVSIPLSTAGSMAPIDTANLRLTFTAPANGSVLVRINCTVFGAVTSPAIFLGVMSGGAVVGRMAPDLTWAGAQSAVSFVSAEALFLVTGLTPGSTQTWDAAKGVETIVANSTIRYGGGNSATVNDGFGGFAFEIWSTA